MSTDIEAVRAEAGLAPRRIYKITETTPEELERRAAQIRPLVRFDGALWFIKPCHLTKHSFLWSPRKYLKAPELLIIGQFRCLHRYGHYVFFKPSVAEVLWQVPEEMLDRARAFELTTQPCDAKDLAEEQEATNQGFHVSMITVYA